MSPVHTLVLKCFDEDTDVGGAEPRGSIMEGLESFSVD